MLKALLDAAPAIRNFADNRLIDSVEFCIFVLIFLIAVFIAYMIYRAKKRR